MTYEEHLEDAIRRGKIAFGDPAPISRTPPAANRMTIQLAIEWKPPVLARIFVAVSSDWLGYPFVMRWIIFSDRDISAIPATPDAIFFYEEFVKMSEETKRIVARLGIHAMPIVVRRRNDRFQHCDESPRDSQR